MRKVEFTEEYPGAQFEFFASNDPSNFQDIHDILLQGGQEDISGKQLENDQSYRCYGLKITQLANTNSYGPLASVKNFRYHLQGMSYNLFLVKA